MKKELVGYVSGMINILGANGGDTKSIGLDDLLDYIIDIPEENTDVAEDNARYVARITELETENIKIRNEDGLLKIQLLEKEPVSLTLSLQAELQELKSSKPYKEFEMQELKRQLAEAEESLQNMMDNESRLNKRVEVAENTKKGWATTAYKVMEENEELRDQLAKLTGPQWVD